MRLFKRKHEDSMENKKLRGRKFKDKKIERQKLKNEKRQSKKIRKQKANLKKRKKLEFSFFKKTKYKIQRLKDKIANHIQNSVRLEIVFIAAISLIAALGVFITVAQVMRQTNLGREEYITYDENRTNVQNKLLNAVQQINQLGENIKMTTNLNLTSMRGMIEREELYVFTEYINNNWEVIGESEEPYLGGYFKENYGKVLDEVDVEPLYQALKNLLKEGKWEENRVKTQIEDFYKAQYITIEEMKERRIKEIMKEIDSQGNDAIDTETYLIDGKGEIMYQESFIQSLDIVKVIKKASGNNGKSYGEGNAFTSIYPVIYNNEVYYLFNDSILRGETHYYYNAIGYIIGFIGGAGLFVFLVFKFTKRKIEYIEYLSYCLGEISKGDLAYEVEVVGKDELAKVARDITHMENEIKLQIEAQMRAEKVKNELITNVAHDLRTPLTSIIGYIGLVKEKRFETQEEEEKYLEIAYAKSEKLKALIEDLFEFTKLNNQAVALRKEAMSVTNLMNQLVEELMPLAEDKGITIDTHIEVKDTTIKADIQKITRVFENLIENAVKYSQEGETIYVEVREAGEEIFVVVKNRCVQMPQGDINRLFDRFYRADESRNSMAGGSGLGLAIAKNIVELHGGKIWASKVDDLISFSVRLQKEVVIR